METIMKRVSTRNYLEQELDSKNQELIKNIISLNNDSIFGNSFEYQLVDQRFMKKNKVKRIGTYGVITGKPGYIFASVEDDNQSFIDYGFNLQKIVLSLTENDLQTCWMGGTFSRKTLVKLYKIADTLEIPAIVVVGKKGDKKNFVQNLMGSNYHNRKPFRELFYKNEAFIPLEEDGVGAFFEPLEALRMAPSAMNSQPWRAIVEGDQVHFYCDTTITSRAKYVDMGICFAHFDRIALKNNLDGRWQLLEKTSLKNLKYILSYVL